MFGIYDEPPVPTFIPLEAPKYAKEFFGFIIIDYNGHPNNPNILHPAEQLTRYNFWLGCTEIKPVTAQPIGG